MDLTGPRTDGLPQLHSLPATGDASACAPRTRRAHPGLRRLVLGYAGFGLPGATPIGHRLLPLAATVLIVDVESGAAVVTGPRSAPDVCERRRWGHGVIVGFSPAGASALLGVPPADLAEGVSSLSDVSGHRAAELVDRLVAAPSWEARWAVLDAHLRSPDAARDDRPRAASRDGRLPDAVWRRLHHGRVRVPDVAAEFGVSRRRLERVCRAHLGHSPARIARIARFQRAVGLLARRLPLAAAAAEAGYADQPHMTRDVGTLAGITPGALCAILQDPAGVRR